VRTPLTPAPLAWACGPSGTAAPSIRAGPDRSALCARRQTAASASALCRKKGKRTLPQHWKQETFGAINCEISLNGWNGVCSAFDFVEQRQMVVQNAD